MNDQPFPPRRRHELFSPFNDDGKRQCLYLAVAKQYIGAILQDTSHESPYGAVVLPSGRLFSLDPVKEAVTAIALNRSDPNHVAVGTEDGTVQVFCINPDEPSCDTWVGNAPTEEAIVALEFVSPLERKGHATPSASLLALTRSGNLIALDVSPQQVTKDPIEEKVDEGDGEDEEEKEDDENTPLVPSSEHSSTSDTQQVTYHLQSSVKLNDIVMGEVPTGTMTVIETGCKEPLVILGMSGGTLLTMARETDPHGYTWKCVKRLPLPSVITSLALSCHGVDNRSKYITLAVGLGDGEVALLDATTCEVGQKLQNCIPFSPFHFLRAHDDDGVPVSRLSFFWSCANERPRLLLAIASGSLLRIADMSTFEVFYAYRAGVSRICDIAFVADDKEKVLVSREGNVVEEVTWSVWQFLFGDSTFQSLHARFRPKMMPTQAGSPQSTLIHHSLFGSLFQQDPVTSLSFSGDSNSLAVSCGSEVVICDSSGFVPVRENMAGVVVEHLRVAGGRVVQQVEFSPDSSMLAVTTEHEEDKGCRFVLYFRSKTEDGASTWKCRGSLYLKGKEPRICFSQDNKFLVLTEKTRFSAFALGASLDLNEPQMQLSLDTSGDSPLLACDSFSPDGTTLAVSRGSTVMFYSISDGKFDADAQFEMDCGNVTSLSFAASSAMIAVAMSDCAVHIMTKGDKGIWTIRRTLKCPDGALCVRFSPDYESSFLAVAGGAPKCVVFGTVSFQVVQEIPCSPNCAITTLAFDPSGSVLVIGGETRSALSGKGGAVLIVRVGELLCPQWFSADFADPYLLCKKLSALSQVERAQLLYHKTCANEAYYYGLALPLERRIRFALDETEEKSKKAALGSTLMGSQRPHERVLLCLSEVFKQYPQSVFAISPYYGNMFDVALERDSPRLLSLLFNVALIKCRSYPYLMMNNEMRSGAVSNALTVACDSYHEVVLDLVHGMVLWPVPSYNAQVEWRIPAGKPVYRVGNSPAVDSVFGDDWKSAKGGVMARPMVIPIPNLSSLSFLMALTTDCEPEVFATDELDVILKELWEGEVMWLFLADFIVYCVFFVCWGVLVTRTNVSDSEVSFRGKFLEHDTARLLVIVFVLNMVIAYKDLRQILAASDWYKPEGMCDVITGQVENAGKTLVNAGTQLWVHPFKTAWRGLMWALGEHLEDWWHISDMLTFWMVNLTLGLLIWRTHWTVEVAVVTSFLNLVKLLGYLRGFESCGWLISVLHQNYVDSKGFLLVIATILIGFSVIFRILLGPFDAYYLTYREALFSMFEIGIMGSVDRTQFEETQNPVLTMMLFVVFIMVVFIVALNGYIALLGGSYEGVKKNEDANRRYQRASLIVVYMKTMSRSWRESVMAKRRYFFALVPDDHEDVIDAEDAMQLLRSMQKKVTRKQQEDARLEHKFNGLVIEEIRSLKTSLDDLHAKVAVLQEAAALVGVPSDISTVTDKPVEELVSIPDSAEYC